MPDKVSRIKFHVTWLFLKILANSSIFDLLLFRLKLRNPIKKYALISSHIVLKIHAQCTVGYIKC